MSSLRLSPEPGDEPRQDEGHWHLLDCVMPSPQRYWAVSVVAASMLILTACSDSNEVPETAAGSPLWPAPTDVAARVQAAGLDLGPMGTAEHYHPILRIVIDGKPVPIAENIGVDPETGAMSALHTHSSDGVVHVEASEVGQTFTLGQLFTEWGLALSETEIGDLRADSGSRVTVTVDGETYGRPSGIVLAPDQVITLELGPG